MKTSARFLSMLLAVLMIAGAIFTVSAARFPDVPDTHLYRNAIEVLTQLGVIDGYEDGTFKPDGKIERDEMAKLIFVLSTTFKDAGTATPNFTDTKGSWAEGYIAWCVSEGIIGGYGDGTFGPDDNITYDQCLKMICCALGYNEFNSNQWPVDVRLKAKTLGLMSVFFNTVSGSEELTRSQVAALLYKALFINLAESEYVYRTEYVGSDAYTIPVLVTKTLAENVWNFKTFTGIIKATQNYALNGTPTAADSVVVACEPNFNAYTGTYTLDKLGLTGFAGNTDSLIGRKVMMFLLDGQLVNGSAILYGSIVANPTLAGVTTTVAGVAKMDPTQVSVNGTQYPSTILDEINTSGNITQHIAKFANAGFHADPTFYLNLIGTNAALYTSFAVDSEGDGRFDFVVVEPYYPIEVSSVVTASSVTTVTYAAAKWPKSATTYTINNANVISSTALKAGDVAMIHFNGKYMVVDAIVAPEQSYITKIAASGGGVTLATGTYFNDSSSSLFYYDVSSTDVTKIAKITNTQVTAATVGIGPTTSTRLYYYYNGHLLTISPLPSAPAPSYAPQNTGILVCTENVTDWEYDPTTQTYKKYYPAILNVAGKEEKVNLLSIDGTAIASCYTNYTYDIEPSTGKATYPNIYVSYTVDTNGYYILKTSAKISVVATDKELILNPGYSLSYIASTGLFLLKKTGDSTLYFVVLDDNSTLYYEMVNGKTGYYTKANVLSAFNEITLESVAYLAKTTVSNIYTLVSAKLTGPLTAPGGTPAATTGPSDPYNHMFIVASNGQSLVDGKIQFTITHLNLFDGAGAQVNVMDVNKYTEGAQPSGSLVPPYHFYSYDTDGKTLVEVTTTNSNGAFRKETITGVYAAGNIVFTTEHPNGIKIDSTVPMLNIINYLPTKKTLTNLATEMADAANAGKTFKLVYGVSGSKTANEKIVYAVYGIDGVAGDAASTAQ